MAITINTHSGEHTCNSIRTAKKMLRSTDSSCTEITQSVYVNLIARYYWYEATSCHIELGWETWYYQGGNTLTKYTIQSANFMQANKSTLKINGTTYGSSVAPPINNCNMLKVSGGEVVVTDNNYNCLYSLDVTGVDTKTLEIEYTYDYTTSGENSQRYYVEFEGNNALKIFKPSKYDNNVIFNKKGLNELIKNIKEYPLIDIEPVASDQWATVSGGQPSIKIIHGNPNFGATGQNYKYVTVGSNINFINSTTTTTAVPQVNGTFRVKINNEIFEVPIQGIDSNTSNLTLGTQGTTTAITLNGDTTINGSLTVNSTTGVVVGNTTYGDGTHQKKIDKHYVEVNFNGVTFGTTGGTVTCTAWSTTFKGATGSINLTGVSDIIVSPVANDYSKTNGVKNSNNSSWEWARNYGIRCDKYTTTNITFLADNRPPDPYFITVEVLSIY